MGFFRNLTNAVGLTKRDSLDYTKLKKKLQAESDKFTSEASRRKLNAFNKAGSVYDTANSQRELVARRALENRISNTRGLSPENTQALKAKLAQEQENSQELRRTRSIQQLGSSISDTERVSAENRRKETTTRTTSLTQAELVDKMNANKEQGANFVKTGKAIATAVAGGPSIPEEEEEKPKTKNKNKKLE